MRDVLSSVLRDDDDGEAKDRILAAAFFRKRPLQAGAVAPELRPSSDKVAAVSRMPGTPSISARSNVVLLADRRPR